MVKILTLQGIPGGSRRPQRRHWRPLTTLMLGKNLASTVAPRGGAKVKDLMPLAHRAPPAPRRIHGPTTQGASCHLHGRRVRVPRVHRHLLSHTGQDFDDGPEWQHNDPREPGVLRGAFWFHRMALMGLCMGVHVECDCP